MIYLIGQIWLGLLVAAVLGFALGRAFARTAPVWDDAADPSPVPDHDPDARIAEAEARAAEAEASIAELEAIAAEAAATVAESGLDLSAAEERAERATERSRDAEERAQAWEDKATAETASARDLADRLEAREAEFSRLDSRLKEAQRLQLRLSSERMPAITDADVARQDPQLEQAQERLQAALQAEADAKARADDLAARVQDLEVHLAGGRAELKLMSARLQALETDVPGSP